MTIVPNTLIHIAIQAPISRTVFPKIEIPWILAGAIIPDIPWIFQRILNAAQITDPFQIRLYFTIQASLAFCLLLSLAASVFSRKPLPLFLLLAGNCLMHLLLDSLQIKWGNGVHLLAPFSWQTTQLGLIWPEHILGYGASLLGLVYLAVKLKTIFREGLAFNLPSRWKTAIIAVLLYALLPLMFMNQLEQSNANYLRTLRDNGERNGKSVELDRSYYSKENATVTTFSGESLAVTGALPEQSGAISLKGQFVGEKKLRSMEFYAHNNYRDHASKLGLLLSLLLWLSLLLNKQYQRRQQQPGIRK
jgi:hypothetical protein